MPDIAERAERPSARAVVEWCDRAAALLVGVAVAVTPLWISHDTPYALDGRYVVVGTCALLAGLALVVRWAAGGRLSPKTAAMARVLGLFLCAAGVSLAFSRYRPAALRETWWYAAHVMLFLAAAAAFRRRGWAMGLVGVIVAVAVFVAFVAWSQAAGADPLGAGWTKEGWGAIDFTRGARVLGTIGLETSLGGYLATCAVLALGSVGWAATAAARKAAGERGRVAAGTLTGAVLLAAAGAMAGAMVLSGTRTAWFAFAVGCVVVAIHIRYANWKRWLTTRAGKAVLGVVLVVVVVASFRFGGCSYDAWRLFERRVWSRVARLPEHLSTRTTIWRAAGRMFADSPVVGKGPGTFRIYFAEYRPADYRAHSVGPITVWAHSEYLEVLAETGMVGFLFFALFLGMLWVGSSISLRQAGSGTDRGLLLAALAASVTMLAHAVASVDTRYPVCRLMLWVLMGLTVARWPEPEEASVPPPRRRAWGPLLVVGAAVLAMMVWTTQVWHPYQARVWLARANDRYERGDWAGSAAAARRAVELDPISEWSHHTLGRALFRAGRTAAALAAFRRLRQYSPDYYDVHMRLAACHAVLGEMGAARRELRVARRQSVLAPAFADFERLSDAQLRARAGAYAD